MNFNKAGTCLVVCHHCKEWYDVNKSHFHHCEGKVNEFMKMAGSKEHSAIGGGSSNIGAGSCGKRF